MIGLGSDKKSISTTEKIIFYKQRLNIGEFVMNKWIELFFSCLLKADDEAAKNSGRTPRRQNVQHLKDDLLNVVDVEELEEKGEVKNVTDELETPQMQGRQEELEMEWKQTEERVRLLLSLINQVWICFEFFFIKVEVSFNVQ